jgi:6-phosphogluconolactonase/glucosamine-6-phosphate isomerase/deaminase
MVERLTMNPRILEVGRQVMAVAHGAGKAAILGEIFGSHRDPRRLPAQLARRAGATWLLDTAAGTAVAQAANPPPGVAGPLPDSAEPPGHPAGR